MNKVLVLNASSKIPKAVVDYFLEETEIEMVMFDNDVAEVRISAPERQAKVAGDLTNKADLVKAMKGIDVVFLDNMEEENELQTVISAMKEAGKKRLICCSVAGIYDEIPGEFGEWNKDKRGVEYLKHMKEMADIVENSGLDYTIMRLSWDYENDNNNNYQCVIKGKEFNLVQISRTAIGAAVAGIIRFKDDQFANTNIAIGEPGAVADEPIFHPSRA